MANLLQVGGISEENKLFVGSQKPTNKRIKNSLQVKSVTNIFITDKF